MADRAQPPGLDEPTDPAWLERVSEVAERRLPTLPDMGLAGGWKEPTRSHPTTTHSWARRRTSRVSSTQPGSLDTAFSRACRGRDRPRPRPRSPTVRRRVATRGRALRPRDAEARAQRDLTSGRARLRHARVHPRLERRGELPAVLDELYAGLPHAHVLVVDDGSTDGTAAVAGTRGAEVLSFGENRGLQEGIAPATHTRTRRAMRSSAASTRTGNIRWRSSPGCSRSSARARRTWPSGRASRPETDTRRIGTSLRRAGGWAPRCSAARWERSSAARSTTPTSGMYAVNRRAMPALGKPYSSGAPEVESLLRLRDAGLRVVEVPVHMRERAGGESKLQGRKALKPSSPSQAPCSSTASGVGGAQAERDATVATTRTGRCFTRCAARLASRERGAAGRHRAPLGLGEAGG